MTFYGLLNRPSQTLLKPTVIAFKFLEYPELELYLLGFQSNSAVHPHSKDIAIHMKANRT